MGRQSGERREDPLDVRSTDQTTVPTLGGGLSPAVDSFGRYNADDENRL